MASFPSGSGNGKVAECCYELLLYQMMETVAKVVEEREAEIYPGEPERREVIATRIEAMGYDTGYRYIERATQAKMLLKDPLEVIKFICKDFWTEIFHKQVRLD